jgi:hypothetical protein
MFERVDRKGVQMRWGARGGVKLKCDATYYVVSANFTNFNRIALVSSVKSIGQSDELNGVQKVVKKGCLGPGYRDSQKLHPG